MAILIGAIAYRAWPTGEAERQIQSWDMIREYEHGQPAKSVCCPRCSEPYALVEGLDATDETLTEDAAFLQKALAAVHPAHPAHMFVRDPDGVLNRRFNRMRAALLGEQGRSRSSRPAAPKMKLVAS